MAYVYPGPDLMSPSKGMDRLNEALLDLCFMAVKAGHDGCINLVLKFRELHPDVIMLTKRQAHGGMSLMGAAHLVLRETALRNSPTTLSVEAQAALAEALAVAEGRVV